MIDKKISNAIFNMNNSQRKGLESILVEPKKTSFVSNASGAAGPVQFRGSLAALTRIKDTNNVPLITNRGYDPKDGEPLWGINEESKTEPDEIKKLLDTLREYGQYE